MTIKHVPSPLVGSARRPSGCAPSVRSTGARLVLPLPDGMHNLNAKVLLLQYNPFYLSLGLCVGERGCSSPAGCLPALHGSAGLRGPLRVWLVEGEFRVMSRISSLSGASAPST